MGRLSDYINGAGHRSAYNSSARAASSGTVEVLGAEQLEQLFDQLLTTDPTMDRLVKKLIAKAMKEVRSRVSKDIRNYLDSDPRKAARAVKHVVYRQLFGGNVSILSKRKASNTFSTYKRHRKLDDNPKQRGGNRIKRVSVMTKTDKYDRNRLDKYFGSDRAFALRFINSGTVQRTSRYGNRGSITMRNMFGRIAPWHMEAALNDVSNAIVEYINQKANG